MPGLICIHLLRRTLLLVSSNDIHNVLLGVGVATILHRACPPHPTTLKAPLPPFFHRFRTDWNKEIQNADRSCLEGSCNTLQSVLSFMPRGNEYVKYRLEQNLKMSHHHHHLPVVDSLRLA